MKNLLFKRWLFSKAGYLILCLLLSAPQFSEASGGLRFGDDVFRIVSKARFVKAADKAKRLFKILETTETHGILRTRSLFICTEEDDFVAYFKIGKNHVEKRDLKNLAAIDSKELGRYELYVESELYISDDFAGIKNKLDVVNLVTPNGSIVKVHVKQHFMEWSPSLRSIFVSDQNVVDFCNVSTWGIDRSDISVASILDITSDFKTFKDISAVAEKRSIPFNILNRSNIEQVYARSKNKLLVLTGHFDGAKFYARDRLYNEVADKTFTVKELEALEKKYNVYTLKLGCQTHQIKSGAGLLHDVYDAEIIRRLSAALGKEFFFDMLTELGSPQNPLYMNPLVLDKERMLLTIRSSEPNSGVKNMVISLSGETIETDEPSGFWTFMQGCLAVGALFYLYMFGVFLLSGEWKALLYLILFGGTIFGIIYVIDILV